MGLGLRASNFGSRDYSVELSATCFFAMRV